MFISMKEKTCGINGNRHAVLCHIHIFSNFDRIKNAAIVTGEI